MSDSSPARHSEKGRQETSITPHLNVDDAKLVRRIDFKVVPMLFLIFTAAFLDRVNISNALTMSLPEELGLTGNQPNIALTVFFVPYILFEIPSNMLLKRLKPHVWLTICIIGFGIVMLAQGFVQNFAGLVTTRLLLGLFEAGVLPGSFYLLSFWYAKNEAQRRYTVYWLSVPLSSAFGGLLASAIANMDGVRGLSNWRWIFILEGIATILVGIMAWFFVADFPDDSKWISEDERAWIAEKTGRKEVGEGGLTKEDFRRFFTDPKNYIGALMYFCVTVPIYSFAYFAPTIVRTLGYSVVMTQLYTVPPLAASIPYALIFAFISDRIRIRSIFVFICYGTVIIGVGILISVHDNFSAQYAGLFMIAMGAIANGPLVVCWYVLNLQGHAERAIGSAWIIGFGNTGGIVATFAFLRKDAPRYTPGYSAIMAIECIGCCAALTYLAMVMRENRKAKRMTDSGSARTYYH